MTSNYAFPVLAERAALRARLRARFEEHQGNELCCEGGTCQLPRPGQQRYCSGYEMDRQRLTGADAGRCLYKDVDNRCEREVQE